MTSRERVRRIFRGEGGNDFAISVGGMPSDGMSAYAYKNLLAYLKMEDKPIRVYDLFQFLAELDVDVINALGGDFIPVNRMRYRFDISCKEWKQGTLNDGTPCWYPYEFNPEIREDGSKVIYMGGKPYARMPKDGLYFDIIRHPLEGVDEIDDLFLTPPAVPMDEEEVDYTVKEIEKAYANTDKSVVLIYGAWLVEQGQRDFNFEEFYCNLATEKELMHAYFQSLVDIYIENLEKILSRAGDKIDVVHFADDLGTQQTLQISVPMYREMIKPYAKQMFDYVHKNYPHIKVLLHSCGAIFDIIPDLIEIGVDLLNPVQISAKGMDPARLVKEYGKNIMFWGGGASTQQFPEIGSVEALERHVQELVEVFGRSGNYIFTQIHNFQADVPPEWIVKVYETARKYREKVTGIK
ncbi:uroporphyrinogen decarboxylase family protein [Hominifimenecus sp. rT4P-3]|uniref:uroporphyrinogen decarboxylase family protein n=1 Tax=Hominifimenecus sp. rT4P-3 TaxID=3242979 RepID=UPI003DA3EACD